MRITNLALGIIIGILGLIFIFAPKFTITLFVLVAGITLLVAGVIMIIQGFSTNSRIIRNSFFYRGISALIIGILSTAVPSFVAGVTWTIFVYVIAGYLLISSIIKIVYSKRFSIPLDNIVVDIIIPIVFGILCLFMPLKLGATIIRLIGVVGLVVSIALIIREVRNRPIVVEAEVVPPGDEEKQD